MGVALGALLAQVLACQDDASEPDQSLASADAGLDATALDGSVGDASSQCLPTLLGLGVPCTTSSGQTGIQLCTNGLPADACTPLMRVDSGASDAEVRDANLSDGAAGPCPASLSCDDPLAALKPLGLVDDAGPEYLVCGGPGKDPIFGVSEIFQPPKCKTKADCTALGLNVACTTFRNFGERCTRSCSP